MRLWRVIQNKKGQSMIEYALILSLISIAAVTIMAPMGNSLLNTFNTVMTAI